MSSAVHFSQLLFWGESAEADNQNAGNNARRAWTEEALLKLGVMLCVFRGRIAQQQGQNRPGSPGCWRAIWLHHRLHPGCLSEAVSARRGNLSFHSPYLCRGLGGVGFCFCFCFFMGKAYLGNPKAMCRLLFLCRVFIWVCRCKISSTFACHFMHLFSLQFLKQ